MRKGFVHQPRREIKMSLPYPAPPGHPGQNHEKQPVKPAKSDRPLYPAPPPKPDIEFRCPECCYEQKRQKGRVYDLSQGTPNENCPECGAPMSYYPPKSTGAGEN